ncbi:NFACT family protein [bacterium]|nr:NFACT family protein [bacterium]MBO5446982.1 NFACT family protein [bacterium]
MITFDIDTLAAFLCEQKNFFLGARINKIQQPTRREFVFTLRNNGETRQLYVNINPQFYHVCFMSKDNSSKRVIEIPQKPPMFCMLLRKYLENSRIAKVNQPDGERILEFYIETYNEVGEQIYLCLAFEFMGKHSNVILYNYDTNLIIGCAHNVGAEKSREREIFGGLPYIYPPKQLKFEKKWNSLVESKPEGISVNDFIDDYYSTHIANDKFRVLKSNYRSIISQKLKKVSKSLKQMEYKLQSDSDSDKYRLWGDLIMANLYQLKDFTSIVSVYDYENEKQIELKLDETKSLKDNATQFYKLYNKAKTARNKLTELIDESKVKKEYLEQVLYSIDSAKVIDDLFEISAEVIENSEKKESKNKVSEIMMIETEDGSRIYIGKNNKQNDYIISKLATEDDFWFHVHNCAGSHILLKSQNITDELILKCARLAKEYSSVKDSSKIGVIYTKRKYLRKPPASALGYVTYKNEKEIVLD